MSLHFFDIALVGAPIMNSSVLGHLVGGPGALQALVAALLGIAAVVAAAARRPRLQPVKARA